MKECDVNLFERVLSSAQHHKIRELRALLRIDQGYLSLWTDEHRLYPEEAYYFRTSVEGQTGLRTGVTYMHPLPS